MSLRLVSTRGAGPARLESVGLEEALFAGMAPDGGLFVPVALPRLGPATRAELGGEDPWRTAVEVLDPLLGGEPPRAVLEELAAQALDFPIPLVPLRPGLWILELFHGPTLAFKDVAARTMAGWMAWFRGDARQPLTVLVATSGDTGGAVADAFSSVPGARVVVLYPRGQVSALQERQMTTLGEAVTALAVEGTFDDCQRLVKGAFADRELRQRVRLTSANSINIGRLLPQIVYYFHGLAQLPSGAPAPVIAIPSGNFGNLTAGLMAARMGLGVRRFVAATNANDVVPEALRSGRYRPRPSLRTLSNAMDVGDPSNFERMLYLHEGDLEALRAELAGSAWSDEATRETIRRVHRETGRVLDPHTAVGLLALEEQLAREPAGTPGILLATAHPAKFREIVEPLIGEPVPLPARLARCLDRPVRSRPLAADPDGLRSLLLELSGSSGP